MASNFPGLKDPRKQSRLGRLADRDVELGHAREWSRERLAAARRAEDDAAKYKAATRRDIAGVTESTGLGRSPSDALRENLEKALVKPSLLGMTAPLALSVPTTTAGKVIGGGIGAALGGIGGEDPYFSALSMLHPTLAMAQMVNAAYRDEPMLPITDAQGAGFPRRLIDLPGPARTARRYTPDERVAMLNELAPYARPRVLNPKASNILTSVLDDAVKQNETTVLYDRFNKPVSMYSMAGRGEPFDDSSYLSGLVSLNGPAGTGRQAAQHAARNSPLEGFRLFNTPTSKGFWDRIIETEPDWSLQYMPEHGLSAYRYLPPINFAKGGLARLASRLAADSAPARRGVAEVVKEKGGNWLTGSVEDALKGLKKPVREDTYLAQIRAQPDAPEGMYESVLSQNAKANTLNTWIDKQLTRYVKNEMATPEDPVRALAERGVLHVNPEDGLYASLANAGDNRSTAGTSLISSSPMARSWEQASDAIIAPRSARYAEFTAGKDNPWLSKLDPEQLVYGVESSGYGGAAGQLGFDHLIDELSNALNPESGLPRHLLLDPKSMSRVSVPQAVERVSAINAWRAAQKAEADALRANNAATVLHKEYPEKGMRWVELKAQDGDAWEEANKHLGPKEWDEAVANFRNERTKSLQDALKYEGDTMGHCVGGYCDDVLSGRTKIYSLRDAKGQPHVTIETRPERKLTEADLPDDVRDMLAEEMGDASREEFEAAVAKAVAERQIPDRIIQIKGKQNRAPNPEYLPFVQDFVKSGQWSDVGDLQNAGLRKLPDNRYITNAQFDEAIHRLTGEGEPSVNAEWFNRQIRNDPKWWGNAKGAFEGFAQGGLVEAMIEQNLDAMVEKQTPRQMSRGGSVRTPIRAKIEKMTSELRQCRN